jgi:hypothetical protein
MMIGVTLSVGGTVTVGAINEFNLSQNSASLAAVVQQASAGKLVSLVYDTVMQGSGGCSTVYSGYTEGTTFTVALFNYGTVPFTPSEVFDNATLLSSGSWSGAPSNTITPGSMTTFTLTLASCIHPSGQTILLVDSYGDEAQVGT